MLAAPPIGCGGLVNQSGSEPGELVDVVAVGIFAALVVLVLTGGAIGDTGVPIKELSKINGYNTIRKGNRQYWSAIQIF